MSNSTTKNAPIYGVFAATGQQGNATARALIAAGAEVRALVRRPDSEKAQELAALGAQIVKADFTEPEALPAAFEGLEALWFMTTPFGSKGAEAEIAQGQILGEAAVKAGVSRVVFNSVGGAERGSGIPHFESKFEVEKNLRALDLAVTVVRPVFFMDNFNGMVQPNDEGEFVVAMPLPDEIPLQMISVQDIGEVAATAMLNPEAVRGSSIEIAGDELTGSQIAQQIEAVTGRKTTYQPIPIDAVQGNVESYTMFKWFAETEAYQADIAETRQLDAKLQSFTQWLTETAPFAQK